MALDKKGDESANVIERKGGGKQDARMKNMGSSQKGKDGLKL